MRSCRLKYKQCCATENIHLLTKRGASGQPDEPLGSINPQASIQPRPGEHFSLINPSDAEALYATVSTFHHACLKSPGAGINCHTCLFMNEQGRCLRGEGVCTTQNSQQCMLKKIFEGGRLQFMVQGCENMCPSMNLFSHGTRMQIICCRNRSLCNKV
ncbi:acrosomal protein SP-10-like [Rhynchocyon petersi]